MASQAILRPASWPTSANASSPAIPSNKSVDDNASVERWSRRTRASTVSSPTAVPSLSDYLRVFFAAIGLIATFVFGAWAIESYNVSRQSVDAANPANDLAQQSYDAAELANGLASQQLQAQQKSSAMDVMMSASYLTWALQLCCL